MHQIYKNPNTEYRTWWQLRYTIFTGLTSGHASLRVYFRHKSMTSALHKQWENDRTIQEKFRRNDQTRLQKWKLCIYRMRSGNLTKSILLEHMGGQKHTESNLLKLPIEETVQYRYESREIFVVCLQNVARKTSLSLCVFASLWLYRNNLPKLHITEIIQYRYERKEISAACVQERT